MPQLRSPSDQTDTLNEIFSMIEAFRAFDADNDGFITATELGGILSSIGQTVSQQDLNAMMQQGDTNRDGLLSIEEFLEMTTNTMDLGDLATSLRTAFEDLEVNGGTACTTMTGEELYQVFSNIGIGLSPEDCQDMIEAMDDGNGAVSFEDLKLIINALT